jgi:D-alanyl-D-alanine carboxypeptidase
MRRAWRGLGWSCIAAARVALLGGLALLAGPLAPAQAQIGSERYSAIVLDNRTGNILVAANPDETRHPASLTKMMTLYMVFEAMRDGRLALGSAVMMSEEAASRPPSKLGVPAGASITVEQAILALVTRSANDVAAAVGERLGGSEARFAQLMTTRARSLGMTRTTFRNASGLPDPDQVTTARDMATLGRRLLADFPDRYHYFGVTHAQFGGIRIRNHNRMLTDHEGVDGIKTGYIRDSGFNIVTSAQRGGQRVVGAVFGGSSWVERDAHMGGLLDQAFERIGVVARGGAEPRTGVIRQAEAAPLPGAARGARRATPPQAARTVAAAPANRSVAARRTQQSQGSATRQAAATTRTAAQARPVSAAQARPASNTASRPVTSAQARPATTATSRATTTAAQPRNLQPPPAAAATRGQGTLRTAEAR